MKIDAYAADRAGAPLTSFQYDAPSPGAFEVEIKITHCGICHSDVHLVDNDWGISEYPLVPGHEIIGTVSALGSAVKHLKPGQRVGVGWQRAACLQCEFCLAGDENLCPEYQATCVGHHGGFARAIVTDSRFAFPLPENIPSETAAPLLCGGVTVFTPLMRFNVRATMRVGIIGIGGLGHLALQFARAFGCEVTAFSSNPDKREEAESFGAHHFVNSLDPDALNRQTGSLDFILSTVHQDMDWNAYIQILRPGGRLCVVGVPPNPLSFETFPLIAGRKSVSGNPIGGRHDIIQMLDFSARHGIQARTELMPLSQANQGLDRVRRNQSRYRVVLTA